MKEITHGGNKAFSSLQAQVFIFIPSEECVWTSDGACSPKKATGKMAYCQRDLPFEITFEIVAGDHGDLEMRCGPPIYLSGCWSVSCGYDYCDLKMRRMNNISKCLPSDRCGLSM